jgi:hypothetical protein
LSGLGEIRFSLMQTGGETHLVVQRQPVSGSATEPSLSDTRSGAAERAPLVEGAGALRTHEATFRLAVALVIVVAMLCFVALATLRWDMWTGKLSQVTDDTCVAADLTPLSSRIDMSDDGK